MLIVNCKLGEGFSLLGFHIRADRIYDSDCGYRVWFRVSDETESLLFKTFLTVGAWFVIPLQHDSILVQLSNASSSRCEVRFDAPEDIEIRRLKRLPRIAEPDYFRRGDRQESYEQ